ncbi:hypothetical protein GCM10027051_28990 [Niabella terrae]
MLTVTVTNFHDKLEVEDEEVVLNGPPGALKGQIVLSNPHTEALRIKALPLQHASRSTLLKSDQQQALRLSVRLQPQEKKREQLVHEIDAKTPPGIYETSLLVGGKKRKLKMIVQPLVAVNIQPRHFSFQGTAPGTSHNAVITVTNTGNMPFQIPEIKHLSLLDMDYLCRATALAIRSKGAAQSHEAMMDELTRNVHQNMTDWITATVKQSGQIVEPGATLLIDLEIKLPGNTDALRDYSGDIRFWNRVLTYTIKAHHLKITKNNGKQK